MTALGAKREFKPRHYRFAEKTEAATYDGAASRNGDFCLPSAYPKLGPVDP